MNLDPNAKYCMYLRKSRADSDLETREAVDVLARHEQRLSELAMRLGIHVDAIYREVVSGETIASRPVMQQLLSEIEQDVWNGVLVVEVERLARGDTIDQGIVSQAFKYSNTLIITPTKIYDPENEFDEEYFEFGLFMSRREYKTINRRIQNGRVASVKEGKYVGNKTPYGYERIKLENQKGFTLRPIPEQASVVKNIFEWYVYGKDGNEFGVSRIVRYLNDLHIPTTTGRDWVNATVQGMLQNPVYAGCVRWNGRKTVKTVVNGTVVRSRPRNNDNCLIVKGLHPSIISQELFDAAQKKRALNPPRPINRNNTITNPFSGIIVCGKCGRKMVRRPYNNRTPSLICQYTSCSNVSSPLEQVEEKILESLQSLVQHYSVNNTSLPDVLSTLESKKSLLSAAQKSLEQTSEQKSKLYDFLEQGIYSPEDFQERNRILSKRISDIQEQIAAVEKDIAECENTSLSIKQFVPKCQHLLSDYDSLDIATKNSVLRELIEKIVYTKDSKNTRGHGDDITFHLDIFPRIK